MCIKLTKFFIFTPTPPWYGGEIHPDEMFLQEQVTGTTASRGRAQCFCIQIVCDFHCHHLTSIIICGDDKKKRKSRKHEGYKWHACPKNIDVFLQIRQSYREKTLLVLWCCDWRSPSESAPGALKNISSSSSLLPRSPILVPRVHTYFFSSSPTGACLFQNGPEVQLVHPQLEIIIKK